MFVDFFCTLDQLRAMFTGKGDSISTPIASITMPLPPISTCLANFTMPTTTVLSRSVPAKRKPMSFLTFRTIVFS
jgi:hypothetical protein